MEPLVFSVVRRGTMLPTYKRYHDAGFDLRAGRHFLCKPGRKNKVPSGLRFKMIHETEGCIRPRSGNSDEGIPGVTIESFYAKCGENLATWAANAAVNFEDAERMTFDDMLEKFIEAHADVTFSESELQRFEADVLIGTIDENFSGEVSTSVYSKEKTKFIIPQNVRISQMVISPVIHARMIEGEVKEENSERGDQGWNSSGLM